MRLETFAQPFPHLILDDYFPQETLLRANREWPQSDWKGWVDYDPRYEHKRASNLTEPLPLVFGELLGIMAKLPFAEWFSPPMKSLITASIPLVPDLGLWGAGLHEMPAGGRVGVHLDADRHARLGLERKLSVVLYVHGGEWRDAWGGHLCLMRDMTSLDSCSSLQGFSKVVYIKPSLGRLVAFETGEGSYHSCIPTSSDAPSRKSLALFFYGNPKQESTRPRAKFFSSDAKDR